MYTFIFILLNLLICSPNWSDVEKESVELFQEYIQLDTSNPPGDVTKAVKWLSDILSKENISHETFTVDEDPRRMHILAELEGSNSNLKPLLLLNHIDVVPAEASLWRTNPFDATIIDGIIYGRGALDMKCLGIMQLMSLILLKREGYIPERTIKFLGVADEEILGQYGVQWMIENHWDKLDPEWVWDEGGIGSTDSFPGLSAFAIAVAQRKSFWVDIEVTGKSGHGSRPFEDYSNEILAKALNNIVNWETPIDINPVISEMFYRIGDHRGGFDGFIMRNIDNNLIKYFFGSIIASSSTSTNAMLRNTVALTMIESGYKTNIIPEKAKASLDIRLLPHIDPADFLKQLSIIIDDDRVKLLPKRTPTNNFVSNWDTDFFSILSEELNYEKPDALVIPFMTIGGTDSQFFQSKGVDCYGLIPILVSEEDIQTMHGIDERISIENFMFGQRVVYNTVKKVCK
tara:strand:- start:1293 stop:2669 length:1377 start_codon:yes stop_codon:yes gene_type:complete